jgi:N-acetylneuraminate lyase
MDKFKGIFPALVTPFTKKGKINERAFADIINMNLEKGVRGFFVNGSSAEAFLMSMEERKYALEVVKDIVKNRCTLIAHIGSISTHQSIELAQHAAKLKVDAISSVPPFYHKFSFDEIKNYYTDIIFESKMPMIIYNFPNFTGVTFNDNDLKNLVEVEGIIGVKHTSMDLYQFEKIRAVSDKLIMFNGYDEVFLAGLSLGADAAIGSTFNFTAHKFIQIKKLFEEKRLEEARAIQVEANRIMEALVNVGLIRGIKYVLGKQGIDCGTCRKPFRSLTEDEKVILDGIMHLI